MYAIDQFGFKNIISLHPPYLGGLPRAWQKDEYFKLCTALVQEQVYAWGIASSFVCLGSPPGMADAMLLKPNWSIGSDVNLTWRCFFDPCFSSNDNESPVSSSLDQRILLSMSLEETPVDFPTILQSQFTNGSVINIHFDAQAWVKRWEIDTRVNFGTVLNPRGSAEWVLRDRLSWDECILVHRSTEYACASYVL